MHGLWNAEDVPNGSHVIVNIVCTMMVHSRVCALKTACLSFTISKLLLYRLVFLIIVYCMWNVLSNCMPIFYDLLALLYLGRLASHTTARRQPCSP